VHAELETSTAAAAAHEQTIDALEQTLFELRGEVGAGRHVPPGTRVLSMRENPAQAWADTRQAALERLRGENAALLERLRALEAGGARAEAGAEANAELVPRESLEVALRERGELEDAVKQKEKRLLRLQQVRAIRCSPLHAHAHARRRSSRPRAASSARRSRRSWASSSRSTPTARCA
jgi:mitotic spindle assembly checkpoint protein MAD1